MARRGKTVHYHLDNNSGGTSSSASSCQAPRRTRSFLSRWRQPLAGMLATIAAGIAYMGYLETRVNTPFYDNKVVIKSGLDVPERFWGSYRPGNYFGLKTRDPQSVVMGLMWYAPSRLRPGGDGIRHWCSQADDLRRYGWLQHDGESFGLQELLDGPYNITTSFVKRPGGRHGGDWTARITVQHDKKSPQYDAASAENDTLSLIWYTSAEGATDATLRATPSPRGIIGLTGRSEHLGDFSLTLIASQGSVLHESFLSTTSLGADLLLESVVSALRLARDSTGKQWIALAGELMGAQHSQQPGGEVNLVATQVTVSLPFSLDVVFESGSVIHRGPRLSGPRYDRELDERKEAFERRFEDTFQLEEKGFNQSAVRFARAAFSNLIGGIGYFYGASRVMSARTKEPVPYWRAPLYTAVPSRSHFPRGFLWDEGFHGLLLARWDRAISLDIMSHWFDLMNAEGWIPREQILGTEALARVPEEFVTQHNTNANPPTFLLTLGQLLDQLQEERETLARMFPRLQAWYNWFNTTQVGSLPGTYRWRGRDPHALHELNPKTLTSGLDDYPRASHPSEEERHVDLRCWMQLGARVLAEIADKLGRASTAARYKATADGLGESEELARLHWSTYTNAFSDYGVHTDAVALKREAAGARGAAPGLLRVSLRAPEPRLVDSSLGYVSLFPLLLKILPPDCPQLAKLLAILPDPNLLWTPFGLRSLSKSSPMYMKYNTEHDPPYWRGQIWMNMNYLAVGALKHYATQQGPSQQLAATLYQNLRHNLIENVMKQYKRTGYLWEQYSDSTGKGSGCKPFTGWTSLIVLVMAEQF